MEPQNLAIVSAEENSAQELQARVIFQCTTRAGQTWRIVFEASNEQFCCEVAKEHDLLGEPVFADADDEATLSIIEAFVISLANVTNRPTVVWQGPVGNKQKPCRIVVVDDGVVCEALYRQDRMGALVFVPVDDKNAATIFGAFLISFERDQRAQIELDNHRAFRTIPIAHGCEVSPDGVCHYHSEPNPMDGLKRVVVLSSSQNVPLPATYDHRDETPDQCIFCGEPEERR